MATRILREWVIGEPAANLAGLKALDTTNYQNSVVVDVFEFGSFYLDATATDTPDDLNIVQPTTGPGRWIRLTPASLFVNSSQKVLMDYLYTAGGQTGGMTLAGGNGAGEGMFIESTANATKGTTQIGATGLFVDETLTHNSVSIGSQLSTFAGTHMMLSLPRDGANYDGNLLEYYAGNDAGGPSTLFAKARGTIASPVIVQSNDALGVVTFLGYDGTNFRQAARIFGIAGNTITPGSVVSGRLEFDTADSSGVFGTVMNLDASKNTNIFGAFRPNNDAGTAGYVLTSAGAGTYPTWAAPAAPSGSAGGDLGGTYPNPTVNAIHSATTSINVSSATAPTTGQVLTATSSTTATWQTPGGGGLAYTVVSGASQSMAVNNGYVFTNGGVIVATLPATFAVADIVDCIVTGAGALTIDYGSGVNINFLNLTSTTTTGSISTVDLQCRITLMGVVANTTWQVINCVGNVSLN